jgi:hypothetical protein
MAKISKYKPDSFYANTNSIDFYLDIWENTVNLSTTGDTSIEIHTKYNLRPDLMAYDMYGSPNYWWVFALKNKDKLIDPVEDFKAGLTIVVPPKNGLRSLLG